jgi:hypothetical protein
MTSTYYTHKNYLRPFKVMVDEEKKVLTIFKEKENEDGKYEEKALCEKNYEKIFIGKSIHNETTDFSGAYGKKYNGNTILIKISQYKYMFIGDEISTFYSKSEIKTYFSPIGNNDVPYPYAIDDVDRYYLITENVILDKIPKEYQEEPYDYYYQLNLITTDIGFSPPKKPFKQFKNIKEFYIDNDQYTLRYYPESRSNKYITGKYAIVTKINNTKHYKELTEEEYRKLLDEYAKLNGITDLLPEKFI